MRPARGYFLMAPAGGTRRVYAKHIRALTTTPVAGALPFD
jgi:hypothetical protein